MVVDQWAHSHLFRVHNFDEESFSTTLSSIRNHNEWVSRTNIHYVVPGIAGTPHGEGFKDVFEAVVKSNLPCSVAVLEEALKLLGIKSVLSKLRHSQFFANKFGVDIKELLAHSAVYKVIEYHRVPVVNHLEYQKFLELFLFKSPPGCYYVKLRLFYTNNRIYHAALYYKYEEEFLDLSTPIGSIRDSLGKVDYLFSSDAEAAESLFSSFYQVRADLV